MEHTKDGKLTPLDIKKLTFMATNVARMASGFDNKKLRIIAGKFFRSRHTGMLQEEFDILFDEEEIELINIMVDLTAFMRFMQTLQRKL